MTSYGQFCPVAKAMELLDERWTMLVMRELLAGSRHFNELRRGVPRMSPSLLSKRLTTLIRAGLVERFETGNRVSYVPTAAGRELQPIVDALGAWGTRWIPQLGEEDFDPHLLMWDIHRNLDHTVMPDTRTVLRFVFPELPTEVRQWWVVATSGDVDLCDFDPGHEVHATIESDLRTMTQVWRGDVPWNAAAASGSLTVHGSTTVRRAVPTWLKLSTFATVARPPVTATTGTSGPNTSRSPSESSLSA
jgi:DNA-binding HxlR family transcriptional regulator